ncbi:hypothetical protein [uncultured Chryseobacterium sp.]|uniref:hypothetical protein n=1 Tax=uncultured Chryseobacterium sp. TaxID=259322 RepID=UPI002585FD98|nr:hypothetical protein [uncultured Chryseobacterium sp.]
MKKSYFLMLMALVFLLQGCRTETINEENNQYNHEVTKALYDMQKVPQFSSFISRAKSKKENSKNSLNALNDKSKVLVITKPDITSYSTLIRNADSDFEILVYSVDKNEKESFYKAKYIPENKTVNNKIENFTGKVEFSNETDELLQTVRYNNGVVVSTNEKTNVSSKSSPCHYYVTITAVRCTAGDGHAPGEACSGTADQQPYYDVYVSQYCNQEQDAGGFTTGSGSYGGTGEYGSYGGGFNALELIMNNTNAYHWNLFNQLSADNRTKIVELITYNAIDGSMYNFMISFFNQNPTTTVQQFQDWFFNQNSLSFDSTVNGNNSILFNNLQDFKSSLALKNSNLITESSVLQDNGSEKVVSARVKRTGVWGSGEEVRIKLKKVNNVWAFDSVTSTEYGLTLGVWSFTQLDYSQNTSSNILTVEVTGLENYNVFLEGLGTVYKDRVMIKVKININTGNIVSIEFIDL